MLVHILKFTKRARSLQLCQLCFGRWYLLLHCLKNSTQGGFQRQRMGQRGESHVPQGRTGIPTSNQLDSPHVDPTGRDVRGSCGFESVQRHPSLPQDCGKRCQWSWRGRQQGEAGGVSVQIIGCSSRSSLVQCTQMTHSKTSLLARLKSAVSMPRRRSKQRLKSEMLVKRREELAPSDATCAGGKGSCVDHVVGLAR